MKYSEANEIAEGLDDTHISFKDGYIGISGVIMISNGTPVAFIENNELSRINLMTTEVNYKAIELLIALHETQTRKRKDEKKYYVHIMKGSNDRYLASTGIRYDAVEYKDAGMQTRFSQSEVNNMKKIPTLAIDWDKALEEVPDDQAE